MTRTRTRETNVLSKRHFNRIVKRSRQRAKKLFPVWNIVWNLRGKTRLPLGAASMMVMSSTLDERRNNERIDLLCVVAQASPEDGVIHYSDVRMRHDFSKNPHAGARGLILDPRSPSEPGVKKGDRPNSDWVRLALDADNARVRAAEQNWKLPVIPKLPAFVLGFPDMHSIDFEMTPALMEDIANHMGKSVRQLQAEHSPEEIDMLGKAHWPDLFTAPNAVGNPSNLWTIDHKYTTALRRATRSWEDFSDLVGMDVRNPARDLGQHRFGNPTAAVCSKEGVDLRTLLESLSGMDDADDDVEGSVSGGIHDQIMGLLPKVREHLGASNAVFTDQDLLSAICDPESKLTSSTKNFLAELGEVEALKVARDYLVETRPLVAMGTTDEDLLTALANPAQPLFASQLCAIQTLRRDLRTQPEEAFRFDSQTLARDRVYANLWANAGWSPSATQMESFDAPRKSRRRRRKPQHAKG